MDTILTYGWLLPMYGIHLTDTLEISSDITVHLRTLSLELLKERMKRPPSSPPPRAPSGEGFGWQPPKHIMHENVCQVAVTSTLEGAREEER